MIAETCGDSILNGDEECDGGALGGETCVSQGFDLGQLSCSPQCTLDTTGCMLETCSPGGGLCSENADCCPIPDSLGICIGFLCAPVP